MRKDIIIKQCAIWSAVTAGRSLFIAKKCDHKMAGSVVVGAKKKVGNHKLELAKASANMIQCCKCANEVGN